MLGSFLSLPELFILGLLGIFILAVLMVLRLLWTQRRKARAYGYPSLSAYLRAAPRTDDERKDAADLALKGAAICLLAIIFSPVLLVGVFPLFYGVRKLLFASLGLGLVEDGEETRTRA